MANTHLCFDDSLGGKAMTMEAHHCQGALAVRRLCDKLPPRPAAYSKDDLFSVTVRRVALCQALGWLVLLLEYGIGVGLGIGFVLFISSFCSDWQLL